MTNYKQTESEHIPVLAEEVIVALAPKPGERYLDLTAGYGGHASKIIAKTGTGESAALVDRDSAAIRALEVHFDGPRLVHQDFLSASQMLAGEGEQFELILADLGLSSMHLNDSTRGFSFQNSGPLDMRMDEQNQLSAYKVVNNYTEARLAKLLREYGEEPKAQQIARLIVRNRPIKTTDQLAAITKRVWPGQSRVHPATRTFQAIRVEVNDELHQLESSLAIWLKLLSPGGRIAIISFHSLEDRLVKSFFTDHSVGYDAELKLINKHPIAAEQNEIAFNPRARSAKLRAAVKIKTEVSK